MSSYLVFRLQAEVRGQLDGFVVGLLIAAVSDDLADDLVHGREQILIALGGDDRLTEGGFFRGKFEV